MILATPTECVKTMGLALLCQPFAWIPAISLSCMELLPVFFVFTILCGKVTRSILASYFCIDSTSHAFTLHSLVIANHIVHFLNNNHM